MTRPVTERMLEALSDLRQKYNGARSAKAFYLGPDDWQAFTATEPPTVETMFGNNPAVLVTDPAFDGIPVRESTARISRLYSSSGAGRALPK